MTGPPDASASLSGDGAAKTLRLRKSSYLLPTVRLSNLKLSNLNSDDSNTNSRRNNSTDINSNTIIRHCINKKSNIIIIVIIART